MDRIKRLLRVDSDDDTDNLHNKVWDWQFITSNMFIPALLFVAQIRKLIGILHSLQLCVLNTQSFFNSMKDDESNTDSDQGSQCYPYQIFLFEVELSL